MRRDYVEPEPVGTILLMAFRITGYSQDCDGEALAKLENLMYWDGKLEDSGWHTDRVAIYPSSGFVTSEDELCRLFQSSDDAQEE
jgi:glutamine cyclotransferase